MEKTAEPQKIKLKKDLVINGKTIISKGFCLDKNGDSIRVSLENKKTGNYASFPIEIYTLSYSGITSEMIWQEALKQNKK